MGNYYGVVRADKYLAHYGVKGMKRGVRKAIKKGSVRAYKRQYAKATKQLKKLEKRANNGAKYARKAVRKGVGVAATLGTVALGIRNPGILAYKAGVAGYNAYRASTTKKAAKKVQAFKNEMEKQFDPGRLYESSKNRRKHRH